MNPVLSRILETQIVQTPMGQDVPLHSHIEQLEGELLEAWISSYSSKNILEIGLAYGISALFICDAIQGRTNITYDIIDVAQSSDWHGCGINHLAQVGFRDRYTLHEELSETCLPRLMAEGRIFDFAFIDGFHTFDHALMDFFYINRMLAVGGIVVFDDIHLPSIQKLIAYVNAYPCYDPLPLPEEFKKDRVVRVRQMMNTFPTRISGFIKTANDERPWDWYHDF